MTGTLTLKSQNSYIADEWQTTGLGFVDITNTRTGWLGVGGNGTDICDFWLANDKGDVSLRPGINGKAKVADAEIATTTPPQEYDLPLADGWTKSRHCKYCQTQENLCLVNCSINGPAVIGSFCVATLPVGFRPKEIWAFPGHVYKSVERRTADVLVLPNGEIHVYADTDGSYVSFLCAFITSG